MHSVRIVGCQNLLSPGLKLRRRRAAALGGNFQRPAEMLAGMAKTDAQSIMRANVIIERAELGELLGQRGRGFGDAGFEAAPDLARQPWLALRAAADHDSVGAGHFERGERLLE